MPAAPAVPLLQVDGLTVRYPSHNAGFAAVQDLSFGIMPGEAVALVGESGCGKSTTALAVMGLLPPAAAVSGRILLDGHDIGQASARSLRKLRGNQMAMIFQDPMAS